MTESEVLSRRSVDGGEVRIERNDQFQLVAENDGEVWFRIEFMVLRIKDVWEYGDVERWVKFWSEDGGDHELLGRRDRTGVPAHHRYLLKCSSPTAIVKTAPAGETPDDQAGIERVTDLEVHHQPRTTVLDTVLPHLRTALTDSDWIGDGRTDTATASGTTR